MMMMNCSIILEYIDRRTKRILNRRPRTNATVALKSIRNAIEISIKSQSNNDIFITKSFEVIEKSNQLDELKIFVPEFLCFISVKGINDIDSNAFRSLFLVNRKRIDDCGSEENFNSNIIKSANSPDKDFMSTKDSVLKGKITTPPKFGLSSITNIKLKKKSITPIKSGYSPENKRLNKSPVKAFANTIPPIVTFKPNKLQSKLILNKEQNEIIDICLNGQNVFFTGGAGTGKSTVLSHLIELLQSKYGRDKVFVTATTGLAACAIGGTTVHQFAGLGLQESMTTEDIKKDIISKPYVVRRWRTAKVLIIDEVSMLSLKMLELLNAIGQAARVNNAPMGGLQVVLCGDFFQLPPIQKHSPPPSILHSHLPSTSSSYSQCSQSQLPDFSQSADSEPQPPVNQPPPPPPPPATATHSSHRFCFQSPLWQSLIACHMMLSQVFRQREQEFINLLEDIRWGRTTSKVLSAFSGCVGRSFDVTDGILPTRIFTHRNDVDILNRSELAKLPGGVEEFRACDTGDPHLPYLQQLRTHCPARALLQLKIGSQVMLVKTIDASEGLVNGSRGVVTGFTRDSRRPIVRFAVGVERMIGSETFSFVLGGTVMAQRTQVPLELAWALSVHKVQGMTVDRAELCLKRSFECGQAYVALSRVRSMEGLSLLSPVTAAQIKAHPDVIQFYQHILSKLNK